jgi:hypothetical protein
MLINSTAASTPKLCSLWVRFKLESLPFLKLFLLEIEVQKTVGYWAENAVGATRQYPQAMSLTDSL